VGFDPLTVSEAADEIARLASGTAKGYVVKPYSEFMPRAADDTELRAILNGAALCLADGAGIVWAAHYLGLPGGRARALLQLPLSLLALALNPAAVRDRLPEPMAGVDLTWRMLDRLDEAGCSVYLLGGIRREVEGTRRRLEAKYRRLRLVGARDGYFRREGPENEALIREINAARPDVLLVALGFPGQERWIARNLERLDVRVAVAEGGSFSFMSGAVPRAPRWMRRAGLEWLYRLLRQPWRLRRQMAIPRFVWLVLRERLGRA
jgi:N-acetylglucosaminyldiphosphoundecaprenol N-acetyl-beta-D-mannosaminyltransferase